MKIRYLILAATLVALSAGVLLAAPEGGYFHQTWSVTDAAQARTDAGIDQCPLGTVCMELCLVNELQEMPTGTFECKPFPY